MPMPGAVVIGVSQSEQLGGSPVQRGKGVDAGGGDVVHRAGFYLRGPQREPVRANTAWMLPP